MREIKFRAWDKGKQFMLGGRMTLAGLQNFTNHNNYEWMQYTGLKDKNGKEIYEGDVVVIYTASGKEYRRGDVRWSIDETGYQIGDEGCWILGIYTGMYGKNCVEVIGDIYSNPELIK